MNFCADDFILTLILCIAAILLFVNIIKKRTIKKRTIKLIRLQ